MPINAAKELCLFCLLYVAEKQSIQMVHRKKGLVSYLIKIKANYADWFLKNVTDHLNIAIYVMC